MKKIKILKIILGAVFVLEFALSLFLLAAPLSARAQVFQAEGYQAQVDLPTMQKSTPIDSQLLGKYVLAIYNYGLAIVGILGAIMLMAGGLIWLTSGGNTTKIGQAKELMFGSIIGMVILLSTYLILNTINPNLTNLSQLKVPDVARHDLDSISCDQQLTEATCNQIAFCAWKDNKCIGKVEAGEAKCSTDKTTVPAPVICCCQQNPVSFEYIACKWATSMGTSYITQNDNPAGSTALGDCAACGTAYTHVASGQEYRCAKAKQDEQNAAKDDNRFDCAQKANHSACMLSAKLPNGTTLPMHGYCENGYCNQCIPLGAICGSANSSNYTCETEAGGVCGTELHGDCQFKLLKANICVTGTGTGN